jgi:hypothetical protein
MAVVRQPENVIAFSWLASPLPPLLSRDLLISAQNESAFGPVSLQTFYRHLPGLMLSVSLPGVPVLWACDRAQVPSPASNVAPNKQEP